MEKDYSKYRRKPLRLQPWDYSDGGWYFVTICTKGAGRFLGEIKQSKMALSGIGKLVEAAWRDIPNHHEEAVLDSFVVMPNHVHGILVLDRVKRASSDKTASPAGHLGTVIGSFKSAVSRRCKEKGYEGFGWQRGYFEHIIRSEISLAKIRFYIEQNPLKWGLEDEDLENMDF